MEIEKAKEKILNFMKTEYKGEDIRFCSSFLFGDSKFIEKNKPLAELFNSLAIVERPNIIYIRTDTELEINGVNIKDLTEKLHLAAFFGGDIKSIKQKRCDVVISENLSFFMSEKPNNAIFLYNKGFHLTKQISHFVKRLKFNRLIFFGDIDCQGVAIFNSFKKFFNNIEFYPDFETVKFIAEHYNLPLPKDYCKSEDFEYLKEIVEFLQEKKVRIEQEFLQVLFYKKKLKKPEWIK